MSVKSYCLGLILMLFAIPALGTDYSGGFDRSQLPAEMKAVSSLTVPNDWQDVWGEFATPIDDYESFLAVLFEHLQEQGQLEKESFAAWAAEQGIGTDGLIMILNGLSTIYPMQQTYRPIAAAIYDKLGDDVEAYLAFPVKARVIMAIHLGLLGREEEVKTLASSVLQSHPRPTTRLRYIIWEMADELYAHRKSLRTAIWAFKRGGEMAGGEYPTVVCTYIRRACQVLGDPQVVREELIPWAEDKLDSPASERWWAIALSSLLWAYEYVGEPQKVVERGQYWLAEAERRNISPERMAGAKRTVAQALIELNQWEQAAQILAPQFEGVRPNKVGAWQPVGQPTTRTVLVTGNLTFKVTDATCELPLVQAEVGERKLDEREHKSRYVVEISFGPRDTAGQYEATLVIQTNDPDNSTVTLPMAVRVMGE